MNKLPNKLVSVFWFRRDLRYFDNHGFYEALKNSDAVLPIFIFDKTILDDLTNKKDRRVGYIHQAVEDLNKKFIDNGSSLFVYHDEPLNAFVNICNSFRVKKVLANHDYEPYAIKRDAIISKFLQDRGIEFQTFKDQVIFEKAEVMKSEGSPYTIFTPYSKIWKQKLEESNIYSYPSQKLLNNLLKTQPKEVSSISDLGFEATLAYKSSIHPDKNILSNYDKTRNLPGIDGTGKMSVQLRFGTTSIRELVRLAVSSNEQWLNELIWRDFFMMILFHFPRVINTSFKTKYDAISWRNNKNEFDLWCRGETGYPMVDAGMRELNETGLMHNRVRMVVASFLTKHLLIDWRWGEAYFAEKLLDYELSSNNGNWQWAAGCGCDASPYFRVFNPTEQSRKFDPEMKYIKKWIQNFSPDYLKPIVDHQFARLRAISVYKKAIAELH